MLFVEVRSKFIDGLFTVNQAIKMFPKWQSSTSESHAALAAQ